MWKNNASIQSKFRNKMLLIVFFSMGLWSVIWIHAEYSDFKAKSARLRAEYMAAQKQMLQSQVDQVFTYINTMRSQAEAELKSALKNQVNQAHQIAENIFEQNIGHRTLPQIEKMITDALRPVRFNEDRGYYFAVSMDGVEQLYPVRPEFEGKNVLDLTDAKGNLVIQDEIDRIKESGQGFVKSYWTKPAADPAIQFPKISFVKQFEPLNWYLGTGEYLDEFEVRFKEKVLNRIVDLRFEPEGYFFGSTYQGDPLFSNGKITMDTGTIWDLTDPKGVKIIQEQIRAAKQPEGGFVAYEWRKLTSREPVPKISYVRGIDEWGWVIGAGVYVDTIESIISENRKQLNAGLKKRLIRSLVLLSGLLCLIYFFSTRISRQIGASISAFSTFTKQAETRSVPVNLDGIQLHEFKEIAVCINNMLKEREKAQTARKKAEEKQKELQGQLLQMQKLESIGSLAGGIAHDFNNILFPVIGISELLLNDLAPGSPEYENVREILKAGKRGSDLVNQILTFSRRTEQEKMPVRVQQVLKEALKLTRSTISSDISITLDIQDDCSPVLANPSRVHQIAMNLITNAGHAVESNSGCINITLKQVQLTDHALPGSDLPPGPYVLLSVHDTGSGISPRIMDKIFDPYFTTKEQGKGSGGLGLSVVHGIVRAHKGDIVVHSRPGEGTTFDVYLPVIEESMPAEPAEEPAQIPTGNEHVMLVDDDTAILQIEAQILERLGYQTTLFADSTEAVAAFQADPDRFDLVITDMAMPRMTGARLAGEIIAIRPDIPIIMCTGFSERINETTARDIGIKHLLMKPVVMSDLARAVRKALDSVGST
ncbi:MAG: cache domain-containing protein, partial [Desulfotignum sp.]|nr:cache domain-containing protein [Desulfotignum sp.]